MDNPQYITANQPSVNMITMATNKGIQNITDLTDPLTILEKNRLSRENIINIQKLKFGNILDRYLESENFTDTSDTDKPIMYRLILDLLLVDQNGWKICVPKSMIGLLLTYTHLIGHWGTLKMLWNLKGYYFGTMYSVTKRFVACCYSCYLQNSSSSSRQNK